MVHRNRFEVFVSTPVIQVKMMGRFGNQLFQYAFSRAICEQNGFELRCPRWIGDEIFDLGIEPVEKIDESLPTLSEDRPEILRGNVSVCGYGQLSYCVSQYSKEDIIKWFKFKPAILDKLQESVSIHDVVAHRRVGDYFGYGYPVVSKKSYEDAAAMFGLGPIKWITEESPLHENFPDHMSFLPDFWRMTKATHLLRGNSSFSWWAASLGHGTVYAPIIDMLEGGKEHECRFVKGNWPKFTNLPFVQDLKLKTL